MGSCLAKKLEGVQRFEVRETRNRDLGGGARSKKHRNFIQRWPERETDSWLELKRKWGDLEEI